MVDQGTIFMACSITYEYQVAKQMVYTWVVTKLTVDWVLFVCTQFMSVLCVYMMYTVCPCMRLSVCLSVCIVSDSPYIRTYICIRSDHGQLMPLSNVSGSIHLLIWQPSHKLQCIMSCVIPLIGMAWQQVNTYLYCWKNPYMLFWIYNHVKSNQ